MPFWLFKEEPTHYAFADLERDCRTTWEGVKNPLALSHLRRVQPGDRILYYHTGKDKAVVGIAEAVPLTEAEHTAGTLAAIRAVERLPHAVTLAIIKAEPSLAEWELVRLPRLSVMPVTPEQWQRIEALSRDLARRS